MSTNQEFGRKGEDLACRFLVSEGFRILETNWRIGNLEVDIIAEKLGITSIIEVKSRKKSDFNDLNLLITKPKIRHLIQAANRYAGFQKRALNLRFDVVIILHGPSGFEVKFIPDAFYPF